MIPFNKPYMNTANAFVLRGAVPVFVDVSEDTLNLDERLIEVTAQAVMASYKGRPMGSIGDLAAISFHQTRNVISGEGGSLLINNPRFVVRPRSFARRERTGASSSLARSASTPGSMSARRICLAKPSRPSCGHRWKRPTASRAAGLRSGALATSGLPRPSGRSSCAGRWCPDTASTTPTDCALLPLWAGMEDQQTAAINAVKDAL